MGKCTGRVKGRAGCESHTRVFHSKPNPQHCCSRVVEPKSEMFALSCFYFLSLGFFTHTKVLHTSIAATILVFIKILHQTLQSSIKAESSSFRDPYKVVCLPSGNIKVHDIAPITIIMCSNGKKKKCLYKLTNIKHL